MRAKHKIGCSVAVISVLCGMVLGGLLLATLINWL